MKITEKTDYSFLFDSLNNSNKNAGNNLFNSIDLSEYHSIKSGGYGKLLKAYYAKETESSATTDTKETENKKKVSTENTAVEKLTEVSGKASALADSAEKLIDRSSDSLFREKELTVTDENGEDKTVEGYDTEAIYKAVNDFTTQYNSFLKSMDNSDSEKIEGEVDGMVNLVSGYKDSLNEIGIAINEDNTLSVDGDTFKASDMDKVKKLFNGNASLTYVVSTRASMIGVNANSEANTMKMYTDEGDYSKSFSSGNILDSLI